MRALFINLGLLQNAAKLLKQGVNVNKFHQLSIAFFLLITCVGFSQDKKEKKEDVYTKKAEILEKELHDIGNQFFKGMHTDSTTQVLRRFHEIPKELIALAKAYKPDQLSRKKEEYDHIRLTVLLLFTGYVNHIAEGKTFNRKQMMENPFTENIESIPFIEFIDEYLSISVVIIEKKQEYGLSDPCIESIKNFNQTVTHFRKTYEKNTESLKPEKIQKLSGFEKIQHDAEKMIDEITKSAEKLPYGPPLK